MDENKSSIPTPNNENTPKPAAKFFKKKGKIGKGKKNPFQPPGYKVKQPSKVGLNTLSAVGKKLSPGNTIEGVETKVLPITLNEVSDYFKETIGEELLIPYLAVGHARAQAFLEALLEKGMHKRALEVSGLTWGVISGWQACKEFRAVYDAVCAALDTRRKKEARDALHTRAVDGVPEPVYQGGKRVGKVQRYSDKCLELELKGLDRETFGNTGDDNAPKVAVQINIEGVPGVASVHHAYTMPALPDETDAEQAISDAVQGISEQSNTDTESV